VNRPGSQPNGCAFHGGPNPATVLYIAVLGLAGWSFALGLAATRPALLFQILTEREARGDRRSVR
jgi:hypothetical protein